jgi:hypothetical protein
VAPQPKPKKPLPKKNKETKDLGPLGGSPTKTNNPKQKTKPQKPKQKKTKS